MVPCAWGLASARGVVLKKKLLWTHGSTVSVVIFDEVRLLWYMTPSGTIVFNGALAGWIKAHAQAQLPARR
jgi:hypothetical protein